MLIDFVVKNDNKVLICLHDCSGRKNATDTYLIFEYVCENPDIANILKNHIQKEYEDKIRIEKQQAYNEGYFDGKNKRRKFIYS